jgi:NTE family protein
LFRIVHINFIMNKMANQRLISCLLFISLVLSVQAFPHQRPKIGLVLDGGGALGLAHIGTLKMLDEHQIPVDYVVGTSIGGIVAALYSMGYSGDEIQKMAQKMDWKYYFSDAPERSLQPFFQKKLSGKYQFDLQAESVIPSPPSGLIFGQKITLFFTSLTIPYEDLNNFDQLPIPFRCVAVDLISGKEVILKKGSLSMAMRSTMSIPTVFSPVEWNDYLLIDGGLLNNLPVDVAREMGADIVIAVDLKKPLLKREELESAFNILRQSIKIVELDHSSTNAAQADFVISPDLRAYTMFDFFFKDKLKGIIKAGDKAAEKSWPVLKDMLEKQNVLKKDYLNHKQTSIDDPLIHSIHIKGLKTIPYREIQKRLEIQKGKPFNSALLEKKLPEVKHHLRLQSLCYEVIPVSSTEIKIVFTVEESDSPMIKQVSIIGNAKLPTPFIKGLLGLKKDTRFDELKIVDNIMKIYSLRYFKNIWYEIVLLSKNEIELKILVKESKQNSYHLGLRYDDRHKIVGAAAFNANNVLFPGLRFENEFQFIGISRFHSLLYYPTRSFDVPVYPFLNLRYKDIPTHIFDGKGNVLFNYRDRSLDFGLGVGFLFSNIINSEIGVYQEFMTLKTDAHESIRIYFPDNKASLRKILASFTLDTLDNVLLPFKGVYLKTVYEGGFKKLGSDLKYQLLSLSTDIYNTYQHHTFRFFGFFGFSSNSLPLYKYFNNGYPLSFIGMEYDQVLANRIKILRIEYRYKFNDIIHLKLMSNIAFDIERRFPEIIYSPEILWGTGAGITLYSSKGTAEIIYGIGSQSFEFPKKAQNVLYLTFGTKF